MKKIIILLFISFVAFGIYAQEISRPSSSTYNIFGRDPVNSYNYGWWNYTGISTDLLIPTTSDTIDIRYKIRKNGFYSVDVISKFDPITTADTIVYIYIMGRNSDNESWTQIKLDSSSAVTSDGVVKSISTATAPTYSISIASTVDTIASNVDTIASVTDTIPSFYAVADTSGAGNLDSLAYDSLNIISAQRLITNAQQLITRAAQTVTMTETTSLVSYEQILIRYVIAGDDATGTGIELKQSELFINEY